MISFISAKVPCLISVPLPAASLPRHKDLRIRQSRPNVIECGKARLTCGKSRRLQTSSTLENRSDHLYLSIPRPKRRVPSHDVRGPPYGVLQRKTMDLRRNARRNLDSGSSVSTREFLSTLCVSTSESGNKVVGLCMMQVLPGNGKLISPSFRGLSKHPSLNSYIDNLSCF
jgi:hypothetical protein